MNHQRLEGCRTLQQEVKKINWKDQLSLIVTHKDFLDAIGNLHKLYAVKKHFGIQEEGDSNFCIDVAQETQQEQQDELLPAAIDSELSGENHSGTSDLLTALSGVVDIDDDNGPAPENVLTITTGPSVLSNTWGHAGIHFHKQRSIGNTPAKLVIPVDMIRDDINLQLFECLFPKKFMVEVMIPAMNKLLKTSVSYGKLLSWICLWILMSTVDGSDRHSFQSTKDPNMYEGAPFRLTSLISQDCFEEILASISYTSKTHQSCWISSGKSDS